MTENGAPTIGLFDEDRSAVFTHPDRRDNDLALITLRGQRRMRGTVLEGVAYFRHSRIGTFNGDAADDR